MKKNEFQITLNCDSEDELALISHLKNFKAGKGYQARSLEIRRLLSQGLKLDSIQKEQSSQKNFRTESLKINFPKSTQKNNDSLEKTSKQSQNNLTEIPVKPAINPKSFSPSTQVFPAEIYAEVLLAGDHLQSIAQTPEISTVAGTEINAVTSEIATLNQGDQEQLWILDAYESLMGQVPS